MTRTGLAGSCTVKTRLVEAPDAPRTSDWSMKARGPRSSARLMLGRPHPWTWSGTLALAPPAPLSPPTRSVDELAMIAFVSAGDGGVPPFFWTYHSRRSAAMPATAGVECDVPDDHA